MILFLFEVIKTKPSGRTEFLGAFLVVRVNVFHAWMIRLSMYFVGSRNGDGGRDCGLMNILSYSMFLVEREMLSDTHSSKELSESLSKKDTRTLFLRIDMVIGIDEVKVVGGGGGWW